MNVQEAGRFLIPALMNAEFEGSPWSWLLDPNGEGSIPWIAGSGAVAEAFAPADSYPEVGIRVVLHCNDPAGDGAFPQIHIKCGVLKEIPDNPALANAINELNLKAIYGRLQLHSGADGALAITCEHWIAVHPFPVDDPAAGQAILDTLSMVRDRCAGKAAHELQPVFGGRPFSDNNDGAVVVMAG